MGEAGQGAQLFISDAVVAQLELESRDDRTEVGVAAALAVTIDGALYVDDASLHRRQRVGHGHLAVVMGMDTQGGARSLLHFLDDSHQCSGQRATVRIAQDDDIGTSLLSSRQGTQGVGWVGTIAVEKVLGVVDNLSPL